MQSADPSVQGYDRQDRLWRLSERVEQARATELSLLWCAGL